MAAGAAAAGGAAGSGRMMVRAGSGAGERVMVVVWVWRRIDRIVSVCVYMGEGGKEDGAVFVSWCPGVGFFVNGAGSLGLRNQC